MIFKDTNSPGGLTAPEDGGGPGVDILGVDCGGADICPDYVPALLGCAGTCKNFAKPAELLGGIICDSAGLCPDFTPAPDFFGACVNNAPAPYNKTWCITKSCAARERAKWDAREALRRLETNKYTSCLQAEVAANKLAAAEALYNAANPQESIERKYEENSMDAQEAQAASDAEKWKAVQLEKAAILTDITEKLTAAKNAAQAQLESGGAAGLLTPRNMAIAGGAAILGFLIFKKIKSKKGE